MITRSPQYCCVISLQNKLSFSRVGGIVPHVARDLHQLHIDDVVQSTLHNAGISLEVFIEF